LNRRPPRNGEKIEEKTHTLLIDGNALFKFGFFGAKNQYNHKGVHVGGLYAFLTTLRKLLTDDLYHKVFIFWDGNLSGRLRYDFYSAYKSDRGKDYINGTYPVDESELIQRRIVWEYINEMYIRQLKDEVVETDDFIAYYCLNKDDNESITIASLDRDFCQLISNDIRIYFLDLREYVGKDNFNKYFWYRQENSLLVKILIGDSGDSVKGVKGLGDKTLKTEFPELGQQILTLNDIIEIAKEKQLKRTEEKKKPLKVYQNIIDAVTDGVHNGRLYEINDKLMNLNTPIMTKQSIEDLDRLINGTLEDTNRDLKHVFEMMERDGLDKLLGDARYADYLLPFKKLITRERKLIL
jgi:5'-3' exonuclease